MCCVFAFSLDLSTVEYDLLVCLNIWYIERRIKNFGQHTITKGEPDFRSNRVRGTKPIFGCSRPVSVIAWTPRCNVLSCLIQQSMPTNDASEKHDHRAVHVFIIVCSASAQH